MMNVSFPAVSLVFAVLCFALLFTPSQAQA